MNIRHHVVRYDETEHEIIFSITLRYLDKETTHLSLFYITQSH